MAVEHLGERLARLRRIAGLTQEALAERAGVSVDVVRKLEQQRKHSARLPTLHALSHGLGMELTSLLGDPPGVPSTGEADPPQLVGHLAIRLGKTDLALSALERAIGAAGDSDDPLLAPMISNSVAWNYQRQNRLDDAEHLAVRAADAVEKVTESSVEQVRVWGGLVMSAATSAARRGDYDTANLMMLEAEHATRRLAALPAPGDARMVSVFSRSSVRIERVRLAVQHARPAEALTLAKGIRLGTDTPRSWRTWLLLDVARAHADLGSPEGAVAALERLHRIAPAWIRHHTLAVTIVKDLQAGGRTPPGLRRIADFLGVSN
ncbi:helix-turn-helix domain-containing protein [Streptomyces sp. NPDC020875]|uniref:helix-turn-helix domain-containing protein n=1 Tax=Streptomyces sp. NPDC020875 TaxID=3154898 RepID=UPI0033DE6D74